MGLQTTHGCWHGPYSAFHEWRVEIAEVVGIDLAEMEGYDGTRRWEDLAPDPIHVLLDHPDSEGEIAAGDCIPLAERLEEIADRLKGGAPDFSHATAAHQFAAGLRRAALNNEPVVFF